MKSIKNLVLFTATGLLLSCSSFNKEKSVNTENATDFQKTSYAVGNLVANDLLKNGIDSLDLAFVQQAFNDVFNKKESFLTEEEQGEIIQKFIQEIQAKQTEKQAKANEGKMKEGMEFLEKNKKNEGVQVTESGLQYRIVKKGNGKFPKKSDTVKVHYEGKLTDNTVFDSSFNRGQPIEFPLGNVIPGWTEGMQLIDEGGEIELFIPYNLGYGEAGAGGMIPPFATLVFKVQLISISAGK
jgi:FKBP-type peptidyl-prolyl cis-trans isomerase FklB